MSHELLKSHVNIVRLLGISWTQQKLKLTEKPFTIPVLLVELASTLNGQPLTLELFIESSKIEPVSLETKMKLLADVASGLGALSALSVVHGDMKPSNVLIFQGHSGPTAKISDFGFCISGDEELQAARGDTPLWNAPECLKEAPEDIGAQKHKSTRDYYSFGLLIW
jgi:serine/threonine protein kinase